MNAYNFPFPDITSSRSILEQDYCFRKIDKCKIDDLIKDAWETGQKEGERFLRDQKEGCAVFMPDVLKQEGFQVLYLNDDYIVGNRRYFCEYLSEKNIIKVYQQSVRLWCDANGVGYEPGLNILLAHEYFHYLEWHRIGLTSKRYQVPMLRIGKWEIGKTGVAALSEIAANSFSCRCFGCINNEESED